MPRLRIIATVGGSFGLIKKDPALVALFILPTLFPAERIVSDYLTSLILFSKVLIPEGSPTSYIVAFAVYLVVGFLFRIWASAGVILKVTELEKGSKLGLREALSRGLKKTPMLVVPLVVGFAITTLMSVSLTAAITSYPFTSMSPLFQYMADSNVALRVAMGLLSTFALYVALRLRLAAPACILENNFGLKTSWKLVKGSWWRLFAIILIFVAISVIIRQIPVAGEFIADLIVGPLLVAAVTLAYLQLAKPKLDAEEKRQPL